MPLYDFTFPGFDSENFTPHMDNEVRWIRAPNIYAVRAYLQNNNIVGCLDETPIYDKGGDEMTFEDGVDLILDGAGEVIEGKL